MAETSTPRPPSASGRAWRVGCTIAAILVVETAVAGLAALPVVSAWWWLASNWSGHLLRDALLVSVLLMPSYAAFAIALTVVSAAATRLTGARTPADAEMRVAECGWPAMRWARYMAATYMVRMLAGPLLRGTPLWAFYMRMNGARIGRRVYVNSLSISDHNLLEFGDDVVIGDDVHLSAHTVEGGVVKTAAVRLGRGVTIGLGSVVDIGVEVGEGGQVGALSLVPKYTKIEPGSVYAGVPVRRIR